MSAIRRRVESLEARAPNAGPSPVSDTAAEVREFDRRIRELEAEIAAREAEVGALEAQMTPEELADARLEQAEWEVRLDGLSLDERIALLDREIAALEERG